MGSDYFTPEIMDKVTQVMEDYLKIGGNIVDTAHIYAGGKSEEALGIWMEEQNRRDDILIFTKGGHPNAEGPRINKQAIQEEVDTSLERLRTDFIDMYALHRDDTNLPVGHILEILNEHVEAGKIGVLGASNWTVERLEEANAYAEKNGLVGFSFSSPNLRDRKSTRLNSSHVATSYAVFCLKK